MEFTSREIATAIIAGGFILLAVLLSKDRKGLLQAVLGVAKHFSAWKVWTVVLAYVIFVCCVVAAAYLLGAWSVDLLKDTLIIGLMVGLPILFNGTNFRNGPEMVKHVVKEVLGVAALVTVYVNLTTFPLWGELILQVSLLFFVLLATVGKTDPKTAAVAKFFAGLTNLVGLGLIFYVTAQVVAHFKEFDWERESMTFALSLWLPASLIPFVYTFSLIASCESTLVRAKFHAGREWLRLPIRLGFLLGVRGSLRYASSFSGLWLSQLSTRKSFGSNLRQLRESAVSIAEAGKLAGCRSRNRVTEAFREHAGITPTRYRQMQQLGRRVYLHCKEG